MRGNAPLKAALVLTSVALLAAGCSSDSSSSSGGGQTAADDKTITIETSMDQPVIDGMKKAMEPMAKEAGITVTWSKVDNINQLIFTQVQANSAPDIALIPQPGVIGTLVQRNAVVPLNDVLDMASLQSSMVPGTLESTTFNDKLYGLLSSMNVKSLVWYNKKAWDPAWPVPKSIDELNTLTDTIKAAGKTPWCLGIESGTATGWPATDWFEDLVMRYGGADEYNKWVAGEVKFNSDLVKQAAAEFEKIAFTDGNVLGGRKSIASNNFGTAGNPMFKAEPGCYMYKMGNFITGFFPKDIQADLGANVGAFYFPAATADGEKPLLGGGDSAAMFVDTESGRKVMNMLASLEIGYDAAGTSSYISPHKTFPLDKYTDPAKKVAAGIAYESDKFLFDGSDAMPSQVGAGSFWKEMTAWINGSEDLDTALTNIDNSWPTSS